MSLIRSTMAQATATGRRRDSAIFRGFLLILGLFVAVAGGAARAQSPAAPRVGDQAPSLGGIRLIQGPAGADANISRLRGKVVVLDFWATWCAPCIASFPHINAMADKVRGRDVEFVSITNEKESAVASFLKRWKLETWVALDNDGYAAKQYGVNGIPHIAVVGKDGRLAAVVSPEDLTEEVIARISRGEVVTGSSTSFRERLIADDEAEKKNGQAPLFSISIRPAKSPGMVRAGPGSFEYVGQPLKLILCSLYNFDPRNLEMPTNMADATYSVTGTVSSGDNAGLTALLISSVESTFKFRVHREMRDVDVLLLKVVSRDVLDLQENLSRVGHSSTAPGVMTGSAASIDSLAGELDSALDKTVIDETGLKSKYDWHLMYDAANPKSLIEPLRKDLGLVLEPARRKVEVLVVEPR